VRPQGVKRKVTLRIIRMRMLSSESELADGGVVVGISSSYQFFMLRKGEVLARSNSCWCPIWFDLATAGPGQGARLAPYVGYKVAGCTRAGSAFYDWSNKSCRAKTGGDASSPDLRARTYKHALAAGLAPEGRPVGVGQGVRRRGGRALAGQGL
jgi:hypothetical protein